MPTRVTYPKCQARFDKLYEAIAARERFLDRQTSFKPEDREERFEKADRAVKEAFNDLSDCILEEHQ